MGKEFFNKGTAWAIIEKIEERKVRGEGRTAYAKLTLKCHSDNFGQVRTFGRLYDSRKPEGIKENVKALRAIVERDPQAVVQLTGVFYQYIKQKQRYNGFNFFEVRMSEEIQHRASFVLTGLVDRKVYHSSRKQAEAVVKLEKYQSPGKFEFFHLLMPMDLAEEVKVGSLTQFNGTMTDEDAEFGGGNSKAIPLVKRIKVVNAEAGSGG